MSPPGTTTVTPVQRDAPDTTVTPVQRDAPGTTVTQDGPLRKRRKAGPGRPPQGVPTTDAATGQVSLFVRSPGAFKRYKTMLLSLSEPAPDEECSITLEPMAEYQLPFLPPSLKEGIVEGQPKLTKASLPCGHGFNAQALLYHFAKNSMTCPFCRAGHEKVQINEQSVPKHLRWLFTRHLESMKAQDSSEQVATDAAEASRMLEQEVRHGGGFLPMTRVVLLLFAFDSADDGSGPTEPTMVLELPLTSSLNQGVLEFASFGYSLAQLNLNLLRLPNRPTAFELGIGVQSLFHGDTLLFRTVRFPSDGAHHRVVFARNIMPDARGDPMAIQVSTMPGIERLNVFYRMSWTVSVFTFSNIMLDAARNSGHAEFAAV